MPEVKIALAANTAIYAPFHLAVHRLAHNRFWKNIYQWDYVRNGPHPAGLGDRKAYASLAHNDGNAALAQIAICDPMVVAEQAATIRTQYMPVDTTGVIVGFLIRRPALWALTNNPNVHRAGKPGVDERSLPHRTFNDRPVNINSVAVYRNCTASMLVNFMCSGKNPYWKVERTQFIEPGEEWRYPGIDVGGALSAFVPFSNGAGASTQAIAAADLCLTCDALLQHFHLQRQPRTSVFSWVKFSHVPDFPFTAVVVQRDWLATPAGLIATRLLLAELHATIGLLLAPRSDLHTEAQACAAAFVHAQGEIGRVNLSQARYPEIKQATDEDDALRQTIRKWFVPTLREICSEQIERHAAPVYADWLCPDWSSDWIRAGWKFSCDELWGLGPDRHNPEGDTLFKRCTSNRLAVRGIFNYLWNALWWLGNRAFRASSIPIAIVAVLIVTGAAVAFDARVGTAWQAWRHDGASATGFMEVLQTISWSPDVASLAAIFFLPVWGLLSGLWLIAGGWYRIARPRLEPGTKHIRSPVMRGAMALGTALTIILLQVGRLSRTLMAPFFRRRTPTAARRSLW